MSKGFIETVMDIPRVNGGERFLEENPQLTPSQIMLFGAAVHLTLTDEAACFIVDHMLAFHHGTTTPSGVVEP